MFRILLICSLLLVPVSSLMAGDPSDQFLSAYESFQQAEKAESSGDTADAVDKYRFAESLLIAISKSDPSWNKPVVEYRLKKVREGLARLQGNPSDQGTQSDTGSPIPDDQKPAPDQPSPSASPSQGNEVERPSIEIGVPTSSSSQDSGSVRPASSASGVEIRRMKKIIEDLRDQLQVATDAQSAEKQRANDLQDADWVQQRSDLLNQLDVAKRKITDLEHDLHARDSWGTELKDLQKKLDDAVADKLAEEEQFQDDYKKVTDENGVLMKQLQEAKNKVVTTAESKKKIEQLSQEVDQGQDALRQLQAKLDQSEQTAKDSLAKNDAIQKQLTQTTEQLAIVQKQADQAATLQQTIKGLQAKADEGTAAVHHESSLQADLQVLQEERDRLAQKVNQLAGAAQEASKLKGLAEESDVLKKTVTELQGHLDEDEKDLAKAHAEAEATAREHANEEALQEKVVADAEADQSVLEEEKDRLFSKLTQASLWLTSLQKQGEAITPLKSEIGQLQNQLAENAKTMNESATKLAEAEKAVDDLRSEGAQKDQAARSIKDLLTQQNDALQKQLKTALGKVASATDKTSESAALQEQVKQLQSQIDINAKNYADSQHQLAELAKSQPDQQKILTEKEKELADAKAQADKLQTQLDQAAQQIDTLKKQGDNGDARLKDLQDELDERDARIARLKKRKGNAEAEQMVEENTLLRGIVLREIKDEAKRAQAHRVMEEELKRLNVQSDSLHDEMNQLAAPAVELTPQERALFKDAELVVVDQGDDSISASISAPLGSKGATTAGTNAGDDVNSSMTNQELATNAAAPPSRADGQVQAGTNEVATNAVLPWQGKFKELLTQAKEEFDRQDYLEAESTFQESLKLAPNDYFALSNLGVVEFQLGKMKEAEDSLEKASKQSADNSFALTTLGIVHYRQARLSDAEKVLRKSLAINDQDFTAHNYLGIVLAASGKGKAGESEIMRALEINPAYADAHFNLAVIYATGKPPAKMMARQHYKKALDLGSPPDPSLEHLLE